jgi:hypothetical protein
MISSDKPQVKYNPYLHQLQRQQKAVTTVSKMKDDEVAVLQQDLRIFLDIALQADLSTTMPPYFEAPELTLEFKVSKLDSKPLLNAISLDLSPGMIKVMYTAASYWLKILHSSSSWTKLVLH